MHWLSALLAIWLAPVDGRVVEGFAGGPDPFARGLRRAVVFEAAAGEAVRAPCAGEVLFAGGTPRGPAVTLLCGRRRATVMPVRASLQRGERVRRGARLGAAAGNVRLSAREPGGAYVRPRLAEAGGAPPPAAPAPPPRVPTRPAPGPRPVPHAVSDAPPVPWTAWAGAALLLGAGVRLRARSVLARRRAVRPQEATSA